MLIAIGIHVSFMVQYFNYVSDCSVQWAIGTRNRTVTVSAALHCTQGKELHSSSITDMQYTVSSDNTVEPVYYGHCVRQPPL